MDVFCFLLLFQAQLQEHEKLVSVLREVDVVISALAFPQVPDQLKIIEAIKVAGNIKVGTHSLSIMFNLNSMCRTNVGNVLSYCL